MKRPVTHVIGDTGTKAAAKFFVSLGWACDPVISDYGEDLIVQTTVNGSVDPFRTLVQVRSSKSVRTNASRLECRISREHALRWARYSEPVLLVLWDINNDRGWYCFPSEQYSEYDLLLSGKKSVSIKFEVDNALTDTKGSALGWNLRLDYFRKKMLNAKERDQNEYEFSENEWADRRYSKSLGVVVFEFLVIVGIITPRGVSGRMRKMFANAKRNIKTAYYKKTLNVADRDDLERQACLLVLISHVNEITGVGVPIFVATTAAQYLLFLLKESGAGCRRTQM